MSATDRSQRGMTLVACQTVTLGMTDHPIVAVASLLRKNFTKLTDVIGLSLYLIKVILIKE